MKKVFVFLAITLVLVSLTACGRDVSGTYTDTLTGVTSYVLKDGQISTSMAGMTTAAGKYKVKGDKLYVGDVQLGEIKGDTIIISGITYKKQ